MLLKLDLLRNPPRRMHKKLKRVCPSGRSTTVVKGSEFMRCNAKIENKSMCGIQISSRLGAFKSRTKELEVYRIAVVPGIIERATSSSQVKMVFRRDREL